jgi:hypothetical protein
MGRKKSHPHRQKPLLRLALGSTLHRRPGPMGPTTFVGQYHAMASSHSDVPDDFPHSSAVLKRLPTSTLLHPSRLQSSRSYAIDLSPHLLYCSSDLVLCLANTRLSQYLEFKALEHICILQRSHGNGGALTLEKVPSSREDVFTSTTLSLQEKRKLMKFLNNSVNLETIGSCHPFIPLF